MGRTKRGHLVFDNGNSSLILKFFKLQPKPIFYFKGGSKEEDDVEACKARNAALRQVIKELVLDLFCPKFCYINIWRGQS